MSLKTNIIRARGHIVFILALLTAFGIVITMENMNFDNRVASRSAVKNEVEIEIPKQRAITAEEREWANIAWKYFENNTIEETGMVNSANQYNASTLWDTSSYLMGLISAYRLDIIPKEEFSQRTRKLLTSLAELPLYDGKLPNKSYNTISLAMVDYTNKPTPKGIGWSAIDIGRLMVPINILVWQYPEFHQEVQSVVDKWDLAAMVDKGSLFGALREKNKTTMLQEGRLGYEEYAAKSMQLMGYDVNEALDYQSWLKYINIYGIDIATDSRRPEEFTAHNYVVSEPYILDGLEFGWDQISKQFANRVYAVQEARYKDTGILTAVSEDNIDQAPYFVYNTVFTDGKEWNTITEDGKDASEFKSLSTKAAFGWHALYETDYTKKLMAVASTLHDVDKGWYSGRYEKSGKPNKALTANTNGIILESIAYKALGPLIKSKPTLAQK
ncbi:DUF3131 domain-containing protein [Leucothrix arctica]|uniref:DUF3131 domain-containing protein n=1 Tax=Leucothrix arctica TaxID=1481894 RepID=A0A317CII0_9GAMM|nr:DUF3131 domain-containing protein [Leucothrix arctica]PWQ98368.1 hypothetical protein DKT75_04375 [Leucothrix arctica]